MDDLDIIDVQLYSGIWAEHLLLSHKWRVLTPLSVKIVLRNKATYDVVIPKGLITDFASIPRIGRPLLRTAGKIATAAVLHDYLYCSATYTRKEADKCLYYACLNSGINLLVSRLVYRAVRLGGYFAWRKAQKRGIELCVKPLSQLPF